MSGHAKGFAAWDGERLRMTDPVVFNASVRDRYIPTRPKESDAAVIRYAAEQLAESLADEMPDCDQADLQADLEQALRYERYDGYQLAKYLERYHGWDIDSHIVSCLDGWHVHSAYQQFQRDWVKAYDVRPKLALGAAVTYQGVDGTIVRIDESTGNYIVSCPSKGHSATGGFVVPFEVIESAKADPAVAESVVKP